jgi:hypothetical protein
MFFLTVDKALWKRLDKLIPEMGQIICSKFVNFLTMDMNMTDGSWSHSGKMLNEAHMIALAYLQCNFKNHIVDKQSSTKV